MLFILPITISAQCSLTPDSENVVGTQLAGYWEIDVDLTTQLGGSLDLDAIIFSDNSNIVDMLPEEDCGTWMNDYGPLFLAGEITFPLETISFPYVLTSIHGNPNLLFWAEDLVTSVNLMNARAEDKKKDLLFLGGYGNQPFTAYTRL